jgi:phosphoribosylaminoimidazole-succinocarboxamide synthase
MDAEKLVYKGKAKSMYLSDNADHLLCVFRNDTSAFNGVKLAQLERKGVVNNHFNAFIMEALREKGIANHFIKLINDDTSLVKRLSMLPVECVVRNYAAGGICKRLGIEQGMALNPPTFEFFYKNDALGDPMINDSHIITFGWATQAQIEQMKTLTQAVNVILKEMFEKAGMILVDYKLEFGMFQGEMLLGDEFTPDGCRIWDLETKKVLDKDRFRQDLGNVVEAYEEVAHRLGIPLPQLA